MITKAKKSDAPQLAKLHMSALPEELLPRLGKTFLTHVYQVAIDDGDTHVLIHRSNNNINGFLFFSKSPSSFYAHFLKRRLHLVSLPVLIAIVKKIDTIRLILSTLRYMLNTHSASGNEIMVFIVEPSIQRSGIGTILLREMEKLLKFEDISVYNVKTTNSNKKSNSFYVKSGFEKTATFTLQNRLWVTYTKKI